MGGSSSVLTENNLQEFTELTFLSKSEIIKALHKFQECDPERTTKDLSVRLDKSKIMNLLELRVNPYADRICDVFSSMNDGCISFEDYLDIMSCFSEQATRDVKIDYAFRIFDFDNDDFISSEDLKQIINRLTSPQKLEDEQTQLIIESVLSESDLDNDGMLSFAEFQHLMSKYPNFTNMFRIRL